MVNKMRRDQISAAALDLFDRLGYHGTGMEDIAAAVGMRASSLYNHFRSKQSLLAEVTVTAMQDLLEANDAALAALDVDADPIARLRETMRSHVVFHTTNAKRVRVVNRELGSLDHPARGTVVQLRRDYVARWMSVVNDGVAAGVFTAADVKIACWALIDMGIGVSQWYAPGGRYTAEELGQMYADFALRQLGADGAGAGC